MNLRDLGGHATEDGRRVRSGCLFRSDELCSLTDADLAQLSELGIRVVLDLRNDVERARRPGRLWEGVELLERRSPPASPNPTVEEQIVSGRLAERDDDDMARVYVDLLTRLAPEFRLLLMRAAESGARPLLFHCAAGKDRTGLAAAIILGVLGVPRETILDDYDVTTSHAAPRRLAALRPLMEQHSVPEERVRPLLEVRRPVLAAALDHLEERWSFDTYVTEYLELDGIPGRLRHVLLSG